MQSGLDDVVSVRHDQLVPHPVEDFQQVLMRAFVFRSLLVAVLWAGATKIDWISTHAFEVVVPVKKIAPFRLEVKSFGNDDRQAHLRQLGGLCPQVRYRLEEIDEDTGSTVWVLLVVCDIKELFFIKKLLNSIG